MRTIIIILISLLLYQCKGSLEKEIPFSDISKVPLVQTNLNNKSCYLMIDTGASISILDINQKKDYNFKVLKNSNFVLGVGGKSNYYNLENVILKLDTTFYNTDFKGNDMSVLVNTIKLNTGIKIVGILGSDFFKQNEVIIDYSTNTIKY